MINCRIFDDIYWKWIYDELNQILPQLNYPVQDNVDNPIPFLPQIQDWDIIILDNFFFREWREQPLWDDFLWQYLKLGYNCKIICVSNYGQKNIQRFPQWYKTYLKWDILWFIPTKSWKEIADLIWENPDLFESE